MPKFNPIELKVSNHRDTWTETIELPLNNTAVVLRMRTITFQLFQAATSRRDQLLALHLLGNGVDQPVPIAPVDGNPVIVSADLAFMAAIIEVAQDPNVPITERYTAAEIMQLSVDSSIARQLFGIQQRVFQKSNQGPEVPETDPLPPAQTDGQNPSIEPGLKTETEAPTSS